MAKLAPNLGSSYRTKHIDTGYHFIRELVQEKKINVVHVDRELQHADLLTTALDVTGFCRYVDAIINQELCV